MELVSDPPHEFLWLFPWKRPAPNAAIESDPFLPIIIPAPSMPNLFSHRKLKTFDIIENRGGSEGFFSEIVVNPEDNGFIHT